ncbi:ATPase domain-containing protein [Archaeoglobus veneficus]|uniref:Putative circadian clock protein, KaiC n=1 Tax=Archaeoglobus veneficus (strain DSM 11195 / SNP6) TaxID=693661 RepID=F2KRY8_ARCVS|nr:ATPase domain-containing protein [Archaeoglobus veneficus]AEA46829.1 putative circadian clock protein, KaiC [Archaeoglobus veneficus SNP6]
MREKIPSGVPGFDEILRGGLERGWAYLLKGGPGSGKTIFGLQFLLEGAKRGEKVVYVSFDEPKEEVQLQAESFGWSLDHPNLYFIDKVSEMDILTSDLMFIDFDSVSEIHSLIDSIIRLEELKGASRVFIDGMSILRDASKDPSIYRRIVSSVIRFLNSKNITSLIAEELVTEVGREIISYLTSGEFVLEKVVRDDGEVFRIVNVLKYRGGNAWLGKHYFDITPEGIVVYPIIPVNAEKKVEKKVVSTGNKRLDSMLGGGIYEGSDVLIAGKSGVGKTNTCLQVLIENDRRGRAGILYSFEESEEVIAHRLETLFNYRPSKLVVKHLSPYGMNLGRFYRMVVEDVETLNPGVVAIDPINSLQRMTLSAEELTRAIELLASYLSAKGIIILQTFEVSQAADVFHFTGGGISYLCDYLILGRYMELNGELLKVIAVMKNRFGDHERTLRILEIKSGEGLRIGEPLKNYTGLMSGVLEKV